MPWGGSNEDLLLCLFCYLRSSYELAEAGSAALLSGLLTGLGFGVRRLIRALWRPVGIGRELSAAGVCRRCMCANSSSKGLKWFEVLDGCPQDWAGFWILRGGLECIGPLLHLLISVLHAVCVFFCPSTWRISPWCLTSQGGCQKLRTGSCMLQVVTSGQQLWATVDF